MKCLFCTNPLDNSDEHIILNSLNGKLHSRNIICAACNNFFGVELDPIGKKYFNVLLLILQIKNASSVPSENLEGEANFLIQNDLKLRQVKLDIVKHTIDKHLLINVSGEERHVSKFFMKEVERLESAGKKLISYKANKIQITVPQQIKTDFKTNPLLDNLLNKTALEFAYYCRAEVGSCSEIIKKTRELQSETDNIHYCNLDNEIHDFQPNQITHLVVLRSRKNYLYAYIEFFNVVCAIIVLTDKYEGAAINECYFQDVKSGEKFATVPDINHDYIVKIIEEGQFNGCEDFGPLVNKLFRRKADIDFQEILNSELAEIKLELDKAIDDNLITDDEFNHLLIERSTKKIAELGIEYPYMFDDVDDANDDQINYLHSNLRAEQFTDFCTKYNALIGSLIEFENSDTFFIEKIEKIPIIEQNGIQIIRVLIVLHNGIKRIHIPYRDFFEGLRMRENLEEE